MLAQERCRNTQRSRITRARDGSCWPAAGSCSTARIFRCPAGKQTMAEVVLLDNQIPSTAVRASRASPQQVIPAPSGRRTLPLVRITRGRFRRRPKGEMRARFLLELPLRDGVQRHGIRQPPGTRRCRQRGEMGNAERRVSSFGVAAPVKTDSGAVECRSLITKTAVFHGPAPLDFHHHAHETCGADGKVLARACGSDPPGLGRGIFWQRSLVV